MRSRKLFRNTPTLLYAGLVQPVLLAESRLNFLEDQAKTVIEDHSEMKGTFQPFQLLFLKTAPIDRLRTAWAKLLWKEPTSPGPQLLFFVPGLLSTPPFDRYIQGDKTALSSTAVQGFNLFMGKAKCATCHFMPLFNGTVPPHYSKMEFEVLGTPMRLQHPLQ